MMTETYSLFTTPSVASPTKKPLIHFQSQRFGYVLVSILLCIPGLLCLVWNQAEWGSPLRLGIDYVGGTLVDYKTDKPLTQASLPTLRTQLETVGLKGAVVQLRSTQVATATAEKATTSTTAVATTAKPTQTESLTLLSLRLPTHSDADLAKVTQALAPTTGKLESLQRSSVGPTLAAELFQNGLLALAIAYLLITGYLTYRFQLDYALCALVALLHDSLFVIGTFALLGRFFGYEIDALFITGMLTVIGFSVHDTIVVYDRLRENTRLLYSQKLPFIELANIAVNQTLARSINTSLTAFLPLVALFFFGGDSTRALVLCMALGILVGTYSSIFVASAMLTWWRERQENQTAQQQLEGLV
ncbi:MAG: protein translocase subunit SecF [Vampirovibrionales bacterium]